MSASGTKLTSSANTKPYTGVCLHMASVKSEKLVAATGKREAARFRMTSGVPSQ